MEGVHSNISASAKRALNDAWGRHQIILYVEKDTADAGGGAAGAVARSQACKKMAQAKSAEGQAHAGPKGCF